MYLSFPTTSTWLVGPCKSTRRQQLEFLARRICLLLMLTSCLDGAWVLEQPNGSLLEFYPTFRWVITRLIEASGIQSV